MDGHAIFWNIRYKKKCGGGESMNVYLFVITDGPLEPQQMLAAGQILQRMGMEALAKQKGEDGPDGLEIESFEHESDLPTSELNDTVHYLERCFEQPQG
jgi:hypothetical protein